MRKITQMEGVRIFPKGEVDPNDSEFVMRDLKGTIEGMVDAIFGQQLEKRWVDAYFPFTEPSLELEVLYNGEWLECLGSGMIHKQIMQNVGAGDQVCAILIDFLENFNDCHYSALKFEHFPQETTPLGWLGVRYWARAISHGAVRGPRHQALLVGRFAVPGPVPVWRHRQVSAVQQAPAMLQGRVDVGGQGRQPSQRARLSRERPQCSGARGGGRPGGGCEAD